MEAAHYNVNMATKASLLCERAQPGHIPHARRDGLPSTQSFAKCHSAEGPFGQPCEALGFTK